MKDESRINLRMNTELLHRIQNRAKDNGVSFNEFVASLCRKALSEAGEKPKPSGTRPPSRMTISLSEEERNQIEARSAETGLPYREIIVKLLRQSCPAIITVKMYDIQKLEEAINPFIATIYGIARVIFQSQKAFPADLQKILSCMEKIEQAFAKVIRLETAGRNQLYEEARKKYFPEIESTKQIRKRLRCDTRGSDKNPGSSS